MKILDKSGIKVSNSVFRDLMNSQMIYDRNQIEWYDKFARFGFANTYDSLKGSREYTFFTKPNLNLFNNGNTSSLNPQIANDAFFMDCLARYRNVMKQLQISHSGNRSPFMNLLYNSMQISQSTIDLPSINITEVQSGETIYGDNINYQWSSVTSDVDHDFSLDLEDTKNLEVYMLFKIWDEYERKKAIGAITPPNTNYIFNKILHDQVSAYKIIVGEDGESIIYFAKLYGVYPKGTPRDSFSSLDKGGGISHNVSFHAEFIEDMNPLILSDFNSVTSNYMSGKKESPIYNTSKKHINGSWVAMPYITYSSDTGLGRVPVYKLKWRV